MNQRLQNSLILGVMGSLALVVGAQVYTDPCNKAAYAGEAYKYFGPTCSAICLETDHWYRRDTSDVCGPGHAYQKCSTLKDTTTLHQYTVWKEGSCSAGECTLAGAVYHAGPVSYDLYLFSDLEPCGGWQ